MRNSAAFISPGGGRTHGLGNLGEGGPSPDVRAPSAADISLVLTHIYAQYMLIYIKPIYIHTYTQKEDERRNMLTAAVAHRYQVRLSCRLSSECHREELIMAAAHHGGEWQHPDNTLRVPHAAGAIKAP